MNQNVLIRKSKLKIANGNHSTLNIQHSTLRTAHNSTSARPTIQNSTLKIQHCRRLQLSIACVAANNSTFKTQNSSLALSSEELSCQREQSQTCLSYAECSRKSHVYKMYETFSISHEQSQACLNFAMARKSMKIVNKQVKILLNI